MNTIFKNPALIIVDVQNVLDDPKQDQLNNPRAEKNLEQEVDKPGIKVTVLSVGIL